MLIPFAAVIAAWSVLITAYFALWNLVQIAMAGIQDLRRAHAPGNAFRQLLVRHRTTSMVPQT